MLALAHLGIARAWRRRGAALLAAALALPGCGSHRAPPPASTASDDDDDDECTGDFDEFETGRSKLAKPGNITVELAEAAPFPPTVRNDNVWWLELTDVNGAAITGAELTASPYMPKHQHGSAEVVVQEQDEGRYQLSPIELIMPGVWEVPLNITPTGEAASEITFRFCIAER